MITIIIISGSSGSSSIIILLFYYYYYYYYHYHSGGYMASWNGCQRSRLSELKAECGAGQGSGRLKDT
jgi:hypothetical protein